MIATKGLKSETVADLRLKAAAISDTSTGLSAEAPAIVHAFKVGPRTATITIQRPRVGSVVNMVVEWSPDAPAYLSPVELAQYRQGRNRAVATFAAELNTKALVVEV